MQPSSAGGPSATRRSTRSPTSPTPRSSSTPAGTRAPTSSRTRSPTRWCRRCSARRRSRRCAASPTSATPSSTSSSRTAPTSTGPARGRSSTSLRVLPRLPAGVKTQLGPDATGLGWVYQYVLVDTSGQHSLAELRSYQDWYLRHYLKAVPGVAEVAPLGGFTQTYQVNVDPNRLRAYGMPDQPGRGRGPRRKRGGRRPPRGARGLRVHGARTGLRPFGPGHRGYRPLRQRERHPDPHQGRRRRGPRSRPPPRCHRPRRRRRGGHGHRRHAPGRERPRRHRSRQGQDPGDRAGPAEGRRRSSPSTTAPISYAARSAP